MTDLTEIALREARKRHINQLVGEVQIQLMVVAEVQQTIHAKIVEISKLNQTE